MPTNNYTLFAYVFAQTTHVKQQAMDSVLNN